MKDKEYGFLKMPTAQYSTSCLICDKTIAVYDFPVSNKKVCEECKKAIAYTKELMKKEKL